LAKKLVILGAGESGIGTALLAMQKGYDVFVSDGGAIKANFQKELEENKIEFEVGTHSVERILAADEIMKSPGIPEKNEMVKAIRAKGIPVISEIEFGYRYKGNSKIAAITGSNGKSTTTALLYHICQLVNDDVAMVGNIGFSFMF
jgi:UDP-N-acetylmuramoylalanine--D-glutamate ligase